MDKNKACVFSSRTDKHRTGKKSKEKLEKEQTGLTNTASGTEASSWWKPFAKAYLAFRDEQSKYVCKVITVPPE